MSWTIEEWGLRPDASHPGWEHAKAYMRELEGLGIPGDAVVFARQHSWNAKRSVHRYGPSEKGALNDRALWRRFGSTLYDDAFLLLASQSLPAPITLLREYRWVASGPLAEPSLGAMLGGEVMGLAESMPTTGMAILFSHDGDPIFVLRQNMTRAEALLAIAGTEYAHIFEAAKALADDEASTDALLALLPSDHRVDNRHGILYALSWHAPRAESWEWFLRILQDPKEAPVVRGQVAEGLAYGLDAFEEDSSEFRRAIAALRAALKDPVPEVRHGALFALGASGAEWVRGDIERMLPDATPVPGWNETVGAKAAGALESLDGSIRMRRKRSRQQR